jgi:hypothetical protein
MTNFEDAVKSIKKESISSNKMNVAKQYISGGLMVSIQVKEIVKLVSFSKDRLEIAKYGYCFVCDPASYFIVNDALTFSQEKDKLNEHIMANRRF